MVAKLLTREHIDWYRNAEPRFFTEGARDMLMGHIDALVETLTEIRYCDQPSACMHCIWAAERALEHRDGAE